MSENVQFDEDQVGLPRRTTGQVRPGPFVAANNFGQPQSTGMAGWLVRHGIMNSDSGAKVALVGVVCINFIVAGLVLYFFVLRS